MFADDEPWFQSHQKDQKGTITRAGASWRLVVRQPPLPLRDDLRAKAAAAVPGHRDPHPDPPQYHGLGAVAMAGVPPAVAPRVALHVPEMIVEPLPRRTGPERAQPPCFSGRAGSIPAHGSSTQLPVAQGLAAMAIRACGCRIWRPRQDLNLRSRLRRPALRAGEFCC
jgi:hypothetical protein